MVWPLERSHRFKVKVLTKKLGVTKNLGVNIKSDCFRSGMYYSFYQEFFLPSLQSVNTADGGCRGSCVEQRALEQNSVQDLKAALYIWETDFEHVFDIA